MSANIINQVAFLKTSRSFPLDQNTLRDELNKSYIDVANAVNSRTIGLFAVNRASNTGESWFLSGQPRQQTFRQVYAVSGAGNIAHGLNLTQISGFTKINGTFTDGTSWYPIPYVDVSSSTDQVSISVDSTNIVIAAGAGSPPTISSGWVVLEWLSNP